MAARMMKHHMRCHHCGSSHEEAPAIVMIAGASD
jgi:hypothetical protein